MNNEYKKFLAVLELKVDIVKNTNMLNPPSSTWTREETNRSLTALCDSFRECMKDLEFTPPDVYFSTVPTDSSTCLKDRNAILTTEKMITDWICTSNKYIIKTYNWEIRRPVAGPLDELDTWRRLYFTFSRVYNFMYNNVYVDFAESAMKNNSSKLAQPWHLVKIKIQKLFYTARETYVNLDSLKHLFYGLYETDIKRIKESIHFIFCDLPTIQSVSMYSFDEHYMTTLVWSCMNQIVVITVRFLTGDDPVQFWAQPKNVMTEKLVECLTLRDHVFGSYEKMANKLITEKRDPLMFSHAIAFRNFNLFFNRLKEMKNIIYTHQKFGEAFETSKITGAKALFDQFRKFFSEFTKSRGNLLELMDDPTFDEDVVKFEKNFEEWETLVKGHLVTLIKDQPDFSNLIILLKNYVKLNLKSLGLDHLYPKMFKTIILHYKRLYSKNRDNRSMPLCSNLPVVSGQISWLSMFIEKIEKPMEFFMDYFEPEKNLKEISRYNALYFTLNTQRQMINSEWELNVVNHLMESDNVPLLGRDPSTRKYYSNFSRFAVETYQVAQTMIFNGLPLPEILQLRMLRKNMMIETYRYAEEIVKQYDEIREKVPNIYQNLIHFEIMKMDKAISPLLDTITWWSSDAMSIMNDINTKLTLSNRFITSVIDSNESIMENIKSIKRLAFIKMPDSAVYPKEFEETNEIHLKEKTNEFVKISKSMERTFNIVMDLILHRINDIYSFRIVANMLNYFNANKALEHIEMVDGEPLKEQEVIPPAIHPTSKQIDEWVMAVYRFYNFHYVKSLTDAFSSSLNKMSSSFHNQQLQKCVDCTPIIRTKLILKDDLIQISPSSKEMRNSLRNVYKNTAKTTETLVRWGFYHMNSDDFTYKKDIVSTNDVRSAIKNVESSIKLLKQDLINVRFQDLWILDEKKNEEITEFLKNATELHEIRSYFEMLRLKYEEIAKDPFSVVFGFIEFELDEFKTSLINHVNRTKMLVGERLMESSKLKYLHKYVTEKHSSLALPITELNDARRVLLCMEDVDSNLMDLDRDIEYTNKLYDLLVDYKIDIIRDETRLGILNETYRLLKIKLCDVPQLLLDNYSQLRDELLEDIQSFNITAVDFEKELNEKGPMVKGLKPAEAAERVLLYQDRFDRLVASMDRCQDGERLFGMPVTDYPSINENKRVFVLLKKLYDLYGKVNNSIETWSNTLWMRLRVDEILDDLSEYAKRCQKLPKTLKEWPAYLELKRKIDEWSEKMLLVEKMFKNSLKESHWAMLQKVTNTRLRVTEHDFALKHIMAAPLLENKDEIEDICQTAIKEIDIEAKLRQLITDWSSINVQLTTYKNRGLLLVKGQELGEIVTLLEDSQMIIGSLAVNRYNTTFKAEIMEWLNKFAKTSHVLENWMTVQNLWMYLEAVFIGGDIAKQLPLETKRFTKIDKLWVQIMTKARFTENVIEICTGDDTMAIYLQHMIEQLELCQKSLSGYLDQKRYMFSRFYFVSDPMLLEILGQSSNSHSIQPYLLSLFDNIAKLVYCPTEYDTALEIVSREGEGITLEHPVVCGGGVENWLNVLLNESKSSVNQIIANVATYLMNDPAFEFLTMIDKYPSQMGLVGVQLLWTIHSETAIKNAKFNEDIMRKTNKFFLSLLDTLIDSTTKNLTKMERLKYETLITIHVHQKDIFEHLYRAKIASLTDFEWTKQERFYYIEPLDRCEVRITDVLFVYQNEFLGCSDRLVITPLTDRCYITLAQAVGMNMGGAPAGPAGTGKTETTKDMGKSLGKYVVVFNCSDQMDYRGLGRIFKGLAHSGTWGCFDEFNRIELPVLSVAAQQIYTVFTARKNVNQKQFVFSDGDTVPMNPEFAIFLTMNPGYAGRQELPENLKVLFRSVAMMVPDRLIIIRVKLAACGFKNNVQLSRKFFILYQLCEEQLSKQVHYDFGLRNILAVLRTLGTQRRSNLHDSEEMILMRVLKGMNVSKLVDQDEIIFLSLVKDLFADMKSTATVYKDLQSAIANTCSSDSPFVNHPSWNLKMIEIYETSLVRHGLMILGPTGSGKTAAIHCLLAALTETGLPHFEYRMNPKAITASQMFGRLDVATNDWTDGIFSTLWRRTLKLNANEYCWLVLDGPVDAVWIENLNSVLDDNKTLTLANGDRIVMAANAKLCFEVDNVLNASPATISRMGMTYFSSTVLPWNVVFQGWGKSKSNYVYNSFKHMFDNSYGKLLKMLQSKLAAKMNLLEAHYIHQTCDILDGLLSMFPESPDLPEIVLSRLYTFAIMWSIAAVLETANRKSLEDFIRTELGEYMNVPARLRAGDSIYEYTISASGKWQHWGMLVDEYTYPSDHIPVYGDILVPNLDNVRTMFLISLIAKQEKNVLLIGEQGTAKTVMIKSHMQEFDPETRMSKMLNFSSATTPNMFQNTVEGYMEKRFGTTYGPPGSRKMTIFIDDINMPIINNWGDQVTNEITRQLLENKGFYSLTKPGDYMNLVGVNVLGAMIHPGGGRNDVPPRLKRQFCVFNCTLPSDASMDKIFSALGCGYFCEERFDRPVVRATSVLVPLTRIVWQKTKQRLLPTPANFHYVFNLRDLSRIWEGMLQIGTGQCPDVSTLLELWCHELQRVVHDKLTSAPDKRWFLDTVREVAREHLTPEQMRAFPTDMGRLVFVDFMRDMAELEGDEPDDYVPEIPKIYEPVDNYDELESRMSMYMHLMNEAKRGSLLDLVFFRDCITHLIIISRILRIPRGNGLLVGVGGSGRRSVTTLASYIAGYLQHSIFLTRSYSVNNFLDDLRLLYRRAGYEDSKVTFVFKDSDIKDEAFLEYINNILSSGEVANLFPKDELDEMLNNLTSSFRKKTPKGVPTWDNLYEFFINQAKNNLHLVLCFSPIGESFRLRSLKFPGIISGCIIDWYTAWPQDALLAVSHHLLHNFPMICTVKAKESLTQLLGEIHDDVTKDCTSYYRRYRRQIFVTPKSFLLFVNGYKNRYKKILMEIEEMKAQRILGLEKLADASVQVEVLKEELIEKEKEIVIATNASNQVTTSMNVVVKAAEASKAEVAVVKERAQLLLKAISKEKKIAEMKLAKAQPALNTAEAALLTINATDISTVRKLGKPPYLITLIMDCVLILFKRELTKVKRDPTKSFLIPNWSMSLKLMSDTRFLYNLQHFPKEQIVGETIDLLQPYFKYPDYTFHKAKLACGNVAGLLSWTMAMAEFYNVYREVLPLKTNLAKEEAVHSRAKAELKAVEAVANEKNRQLLEASRTLNAALNTQMAIQNEANRCKNKMDSATALIEGLKGERKRWTEQLAGYNLEIEFLLGDTVKLVGFLSYFGPFNQEYRSKIMKSWRNRLNEMDIPNSTHLVVSEKLVDPPTISEWNLQGLPNDELSIQNGIIVTKSSKYPVLIDPQSQGIAWIKNKESTNGLVVTTFDDKYFINRLEDCILMGRPLLIHDVLQDVDPMMINVLEKNFYKFGTHLKVMLGDKEVDVSDDFRLYLTSKLCNPSYPPELYARCAIIDFTVTIKGLEDQLLSRVIETEKKELEQERVALILEVTSEKRKMQKLEYDLLVKLTTVQGSLVDDESVLYTLNKTKDTAVDVREKLEVADQTHTSINVMREKYRPIATRGSVLYFLIVEMANINPMYQNSLQQFLERFDLSLTNAEASILVERRINNIIAHLTYSIFKYKCRGLYERHKTMFAVLMALKIDLDRGYVTLNQFEYFVKGGAAIDLHSVRAKPAEWITDMCWMNLAMLQTIHPFDDMLTTVERNEKMWRKWYEKNKPEEETIPDDFNRIGVFEKLLLIRSWCPDRTLNQAFKYVKESLGPKFATTVMFDIQEMCAESRSTTPMICFLSNGSDPSSLIENTAKKMDIPFFSVSMGQGQEVYADKLLKNCLINGGWVLLQNCHLCLEFMQETYKYIMTSVSESSRENNFRIWITTEEHPKFSISLLQISIHFTYEPPEGLRAGLMRTFNSIGEDMLNYSNLPQYKPILYTISFLHSVVQERRKFGPVGWNIPYEFNTADWYSSVLYLQKMVEDVNIKSEIHWDALRYMLGEVHYGGRVTDDYDRRLLISIMSFWFTDQMFNANFRFHSGYKMLKFNTLPEYLHAIESMPLKDSPEVCGLHPNADITYALHLIANARTMYQTNIFQRMCDTITSIQPKSSGGGSEVTREKKVFDMASDMLRKLPPVFNMFDVKDRLKDDATKPMTIFLSQEIDRIQNVLELVKSTLEDLLLAIDGIIIMNEILTDTLDFLYDGRVPTHWLRISWTSSTIGFWFVELSLRYEQISSWTFNKKPTLFWMTGFFNPQGFLTAMKQEVSRTHKGWTLDNILLENEVTNYTENDVRKPPLEGVYVYGLYLEGASWNSKSRELVESVHKVMFTKMPVIHVFAINLLETKKSVGYMCPVYKKPQRTGLTYVCELCLKSSRNTHITHWIMRGVALLCDIK